jgi:hypothetical protein
LLDWFNLCGSAGLVVAFAEATAIRAAVAILPDSFRTVPKNCRQAALHGSANGN